MGGEIPLTFTSPSAPSLCLPSSPSCHSPLSPVLSCLAHLSLSPYPYPSRGLGSAAGSWRSPAADVGLRFWCIFRLKSAHLLSFAWWHWHIHKRWMQQSVHSAQNVSQLILKRDCKKSWNRMQNCLMHFTVSKKNCHGKIPVRATLRASPTQLFRRGYNWLQQ